MNISRTYLDDRTYGIHKTGIIAWIKPITMDAWLKFDGLSKITWIKNIFKTVAEKAPNTVGANHVRNDLSLTKKKIVVLNRENIINNVINTHNT